MQYSSGQNRIVAYRYDVTVHCHVTLLLLWARLAPGRSTLPIHIDDRHCSTLYCTVLYITQYLTSTALQFTRHLKHGPQGKGKQF